MGFEIINKCDRYIYPRENRGITRRRVETAINEKNGLADKTSPF